MLHLGMKSDLGQARQANEDFYLARILTSQGRKYAVLAIADGVGGQRAGEIASQTAIRNLESELVASASEAEPPIQLATLERAVRRANQAVFELSLTEERFRGMGTTLTAVLATMDELLVAHVGDSRLYLVRAGLAQQLTADHSLVCELVKTGELTAAEAKTHPQRNVLTRAIGIERQVEVDLFCQPLIKDDVILLASDGLFTLLTDQVIADYIMGTCDLQIAADQLVQAANDLGGYDNISVVLARWGWRE